MTMIDHSNDQHERSSSWWPWNCQRSTWPALLSWYMKQSGGYTSVEDHKDDDLIRFITMINKKSLFWQPWKLSYWWPWVKRHQKYINKLRLQIHCKISTKKTRACLGRVAPLGLPRTAYKSDVECRFVNRNGQMTLKIKVNASHFQY